MDHHSHRFVIIAAAVLAAPLRAAPPDANALPAGARVVAGAAGIAQTGSRLDITQATERAILEWNTFDVGAKASVHFAQPSASSVALNRVLAGTPTQIMGALSANGQVWLVNPAGVIFGAGSRADVGGLVASTLDVKDEDFMAGRAIFSRNGSNGKVVNQGTLNASDGGLVALLAPEARNEGVISARLGNVVLAAGERVTLEAGAGGRLQVALDPATISTLAENRHLIQADGGQVVMSAKAADALLSAVVANSGNVQARTLESRDGRILLLADMEHGRVDVAGTLDASAPNGGNGGFVETSAAKVAIAETARVTTLAATGKAGTWLIDPEDFTIAAGNGALTVTDIGANTLSTNLGGGNVSIATMGVTGNIFVNSPVTWSANTLTLSAHRNIAINANLNGSGTAKLALEYGQGGGGGWGYSLGNGAKVYLPAGANFSTKNGGAAAINWTVITSLGNPGSVTGADLQGMQGNLAGNYALGEDIDAGATAILPWAATGFMPVGFDSACGACFTGKFDGLGHTIRNLFGSHDVNAAVGLFGRTNNATLQNVGLLNLNLYGGTGGTGALVGYAQNTVIRNSYADGGSVRARSHNVGGLVGVSVNATSISYSYANVSVESSNGGNPSDAHAGGLVGVNNGSISYSYATGSVTGNAGNPAANVGIGGLVGMQGDLGSVSNSYATGAVSAVGGGTDLGGLIGEANNTGGSVASSYWDKTTTGQAGTANVTGGGGGDGTGLTTAEWPTLGPFGSSPSGGAWSTADWGTGSNPYPGLKALPYVTITASASQTYGSAPSFGIASILDQSGANAAGLVNTGGLVWQSDTNASSAAGTTSSVRGSGATGTGYQILYAGSLTVGQAPLTVTANSASKNYDGTAWSGGNGVAYSGFVNGENAGSLGGALTYGGSSQGAVAPGSYVIAPAGLVSGNYAISYVNGTLQIAKAPLTVTAQNASKTYDGQAWSGGNGLAYTGFINGDTAAALAGTLIWGGSAQGAKNVGSYTIAPSGLSSDKYAINFADGVLTIAKAPLTVTAASASKTYDGLAWNGGNGVNYAGLANGETGAVLGGTLAWGGSAQGAKNAGTYSIVPSGLTSDNYAVSFVEGTLTVAKAPLTVKAADAAKTYDGLAWNGGNGVSYAGFVNGETAAALGGTLAWGGSAQGAKKGGIYAIAPSGLESNNYAIAYVDGTLTVNKAPLIVTARDADKIYGTLPYASGNGVGYAGFIDGEDPAVLGGALRYTGSSQGATGIGAYTITPTGLASDNYEFVYVDGKLSVVALPADGAGLTRVADAANWMDSGAVATAMQSTWPESLLSIGPAFIRLPGE